MKSPIVGSLLATSVAVACTSCAATAGDWEKILLPTRNGTAVCLDGSPGGYYLRANEASKDWILFHQGGGWCGSPDNCASRALTDLGSSVNWGPTYTDVYEGSAMFDTPPFDEFNVAYAMYCDGGSWSGNIDVPYNGTAANISVLHYRGRPLLDTLLDDLFENRGMDSAETVVYSGCSAGGLTTYLHADYIAERVHDVSSNASVLAVADAMFSMEHNDVTDQPHFQPIMQWGYEAWNSSASVNTDCQEYYSQNGTDDGWRCMFGQHASMFVKTPTFIINSKYDTWQQGAILGLSCSIGQCDPTDEAFWVAYGDSLLAALNTVPQRHGAFLTNCPAHCQTGTGGDWGQRSVNGTTLATAVATWFNTTLPIVQAGSVASLISDRWISECDTVPCGSDVC